MKVEDLHWLAGLLEGEGSFMAGPPSSPRQPRIQVQITDVDVISRAHALLGGHLMEVVRQADHHRRAWKLLVKGKRAVEMMQLLEPLMGERRRAQIVAALASRP